MKRQLIKLKRRIEKPATTLTLPTQIRSEMTPQVQRFVDMILELRSRLNFAPSVRGWCYMLEEKGLLKSDFDKVQRKINRCREEGYLPINICAEDEVRSFDTFDEADEKSPEEEAQSWIDYLINSSWKLYHDHYFWEDQDYYIEMLVEKTDLKSLFYPVCQHFKIPIANARGRWDFNQRDGMMRRFKEWEEAGKTPVLLYCGDHDPTGLVISDELMDNIWKLSRAAGWRPDNLIIDRFGLNYDFIQEAGLSWVDNLITGSGGNLADPKHTDHFKPYVQGYIKKFGVRKCEANALVVQPDMGGELCIEAITKYIPHDSPETYKESLEDGQFEVRDKILELLERR